jgi:single-strand DNA-binding protein
VSRESNLRVGNRHKPLGSITKPNIPNHEIEKEHKMSYHKVIVVGRVGADLEIRFSPSGQPVTNFSVAENRKYMNQTGETVKKTVWFKVAAWGKQAEACNSFLKKGSLVLVDGRLEPDPETGGPRIWTRQDGSPAASFDITAETVRFLDSKPANSSPSSNGSGSGSESEIPF